MRKLIVIAALVCVVLSTGNMNGGWTQHNFDAQNSDLDKLALETALKGVSERANGGEGLAFQGVEKCFRQVVSGVKYRLTLNFLTASDEYKQYEVTIYIVPWENHSEVQAVLDVTERNASSDLEVNAELRDEILSFVEKNVQMRVNRDLSQHRLSNFEVLDMKVVQGNLYKLRVDFTPLEQNENGEVVSYVVSILVRPWLNPALEIASIEDFKPQNMRQSMPGGETDREWNSNGEIENLVLNALVEYGRQNVSPDFEFVSLTSAKQRVVAGLKLNLVFKYLSQGEEKQAQASVFVQPWMNLAEVTDFKDL